MEVRSGSYCKRLCSIDAPSSIISTIVIGILRSLVRPRLGLLISLFLSFFFSSAHSSRVVSFPFSSLSLFVCLFLLGFVGYGEHLCIAS